ncbi:unknown [Prevotella sp. CAG:1058]|nr:unknown [Prevotella sp. CAG:1058]
MDCIIMPVPLLLNLKWMMLGQNVAGIILIT